MSEKELNLPKTDALAKEIVARDGGKYMALIVAYIQEQQKISKSEAKGGELDHEKDVSALKMFITAKLLGLEDVSPFKVNEDAKRLIEVGIAELDEKGQGT